MKQCPKCQRTYADDNQKFCTVDGGRLESVSVDDEETLYNLAPTVITNQADLNQPPSEPAVDLNKTMASLPPPPTGEIRSGDTGPATTRTIAGSFQPANTPSPQQPPAPPPQQQPPSYQPQQPNYQQQQQQPPFQQTPPAYQQQQQQQYQQQQYQQPQSPASPSGQLPHTSMPLPHQPGHAQHPGAHAATTTRKGSRLPLILGAVFLLLLAGGAAYYFLVLNKKDNVAANANSNANVANANSNANANASANANANTNTSANANTTTALPYEPPPGTTQFVNSSAKLDGKLAEHYTDFSFYYPDSWQLDPKSGVAGASNFVMVERKLPPDFTQERVAVGWYESNGTYDSDKSLFTALVQATSSRLEKLPGYEKLAEGPTKVNSMNAYEFSFKGLSENTEKGDITFWGRIIFLPPGVEGRKNGLTLTILTSSLAPELEGIEDVGVKGELPVVLESFRLK